MRDNRHTPCAATLVALVAWLCGIEEDLGKKGTRGVRKSRKRRQVFLSEPSPRIRFVDTPKQSSWLNQLEIVLGVLMRTVVRRGSLPSVADLRWNRLAFIDSCNQGFARPFQGMETGRPLQA